MQTSNEITNYIYHLYGHEEIFLTEALYSIGTLLKKIDPRSSRVIVFTDQPARLGSLPVTVENISGQLDEMKGPFGFGYRIKLCCIQKCAESFPGNIIYLDCDTIVKKPIQKLAAKLKKGQALMYRQERLAGRFPRFESFQTQLPNDLNYKYSAESCMFNAGVIGIHRSDAKILKTALALCDLLMKEGIQYHICEQFAASEAFRISGVKILEAYKIVSHYYRTSAKEYMHHKILRFNARLKKEPWNFDRPIPYSYPRVQWHKLRRKIFK
jgi:hypothetical protein